MKTEISSESSPVMLIVILVYDVQGVILCHFVPHGETVNAQYYAACLQNHLRRTVRHKQPQLLNVIFCMIMLLHIRQFVSGICYDTGGEKYWSIHQYSPDLLPCDYDLIPKLKAPLHGHRFCTRDDIAIVV